MKYVFVIIATLMLLPGIASARDSHQGSHRGNGAYNCSETPKPSRPKWVDQSRKKDVVGNGKIILKWEDADRAHMVDIRMNGKIKNVADNGSYTFKGLKPGVYVFQIRGVSNCGKSGWTKSFVAKQ